MWVPVIAVTARATRNNISSEDGTTDVDKDRWDKSCRVRGRATRTSDWHVVPHIERRSWIPTDRHWLTVRPTPAPHHHYSHESTFVLQLALTTVVLAWTGWRLEGNVSVGEFPVDTLILLSNRHRRSSSDFYVISKLPIISVILTEILSILWQMP